MQVIDDGRELTQNLECLLMELKLCGDQIRKIAKGFWRVENLENTISSAGAFRVFGE